MGTKQEGAHECEFRQPVILGTSLCAMHKYRRHAIVLILIVAAVIMPTFDVLTLMLVALPMLLYEASILIVARTQTNSKTSDL